MARQAAAAALTSTAAAAAGTVVADVSQSASHVDKLCAAVECRSCSGSETPVAPRCIGQAAWEGRQGRGERAGDWISDGLMDTHADADAAALQPAAGVVPMRDSAAAATLRGGAARRQGWVCCCRSLLAFCGLPTPRSVLPSSQQRQPGPRGAGQTWRSSRQRCGRPPRRSTN